MNKKQAVGLCSCRCEVCNNHQHDNCESRCTEEICQLCKDGGFTISPCPHLKCTLDDGLETRSLTTNEEVIAIVEQMREREYCSHRNDLGDMGYCDICSDKVWKEAVNAARDKLLNEAYHKGYTDGFRKGQTSI